MRLGFYLETNGGTPQNVEIFNFLNRAVQNNELYDAAVFFDEAKFSPVLNKFGMFNSSDLWNFKGNLICSSIGTFKKATNIVNKIEIAYLFSSKLNNEETLFDNVAISRSPFKVIVTEISDEAKFYRLTGKKPILIDQWSVEKLKGVFNE